MKVIDGKNAILGRLASYAAKEALKGEEIVVLNCNEIIITGNKRNIQENFSKRKRWIGSTQKGPKISKVPYIVVKRTIRGMLPNYREGRGREALKRIKCYPGIPKEFENVKKIVAGKAHQSKFITVKEMVK